VNRTRWAVLVLVVAALGLATAYGLQSHGSSSESLGPLRRQAALGPCPQSLGPTFPKLTLRCLGGGPDVHLRGAGSGRPTLVNVYGSWCGPCQKEMPVLRAFSAAAGDEVAVVGVDSEERDDSTGLKFAIAKGQHWPAVVDDDRLVGAHFVPGVPLMVFLDAAGAVVHVESGGYEQLADLERDVRTYLGVSV
jgi:thiol-disulfide isomerase/thioredoxin